MSSLHARAERHKQGNAGRLRAGVLGANDGLISTASLLVGVAAAGLTRETVWKTGVAALSAGALSMAVGEYVSVSAQADAEAADIEKESTEIRDHEEAELYELAAIYRHRGLSTELAHQVAKAMHDHDALGAHLRDELHLTEATKAKPLDAALTSGAAFIVGSALAVVAALAAPNSARVITIAAVAMFGLGLLGWGGAKLGGARAGRAARRVLIGGAVAMAVTAIIGQLIGTSV